MSSNLQEVFAEMLLKEEEVAESAASEEVVYVKGEDEEAEEAEEVKEEHDSAGAGTGGLKRPRPVEEPSVDRPRAPDRPPPTRLVPCPPSTPPPLSVRFPDLPPPPPAPPSLPSSSSVGPTGSSSSRSAAGPAVSAGGATKPAGMSWPEWRRLNPQAARRSETARSARVALRAAAREELQASGAASSGPREEWRVNPCPGCMDNEGKVGCSFAVTGPGGGLLCGSCCRARHGSEWCAVHRPWLR